MTKQQKLDWLNDEIRACMQAISAAELDGERGDMMVERKRQLRLLKEMYAAARGVR